MENTKELRVVGDIIGNALYDLKKHDTGGKLVNVVLESDCFITRMVETTEIGRSYPFIIIDFTEKNLHNDPEIFYKHSAALYEKFFNIEKWYSC